MPYCEFCGEDAGYLPFTCSYCGGIFCGSHRLPENHQCSFDKEYQSRRAEERRERRQRRRIGRIKEKDIGIRGKRSTIGTYTLYFIVVSMSILGAFFPNYLNITITSFFYYPTPLVWTFFTSIFVVPITNIPELVYFLILMFFSFYFIRTFENKFGLKMLFITYLASASIMMFVSYSSSVFYYLGIVILFVKIGLAPAGLIGLIFVLMIKNSRRYWYFKNFKLKGGFVLGILIVTSVAAKVMTSLIALEGIPSELVSYFLSEFGVYYIIDIIGPIVIVIIAAIYFQMS